MLLATFDLICWFQRLPKIYFIPEADARMFQLLQLDRTGMSQMVLEWLPPGKGITGRVRAPDGSSDYDQGPAFFYWLGFRLAA